MHTGRTISLVTAAVLAFLVISIASPVSAAEGEKKITINWKYGPNTIDIGDMATITIPKGYNFADRDDTRKIMEYIGNPPTDKELGYLAPLSNKWYMVFEFSEIGYVRDDEKDKLDPDAILDNLKKGNEEGNKWRKERNMPPLNVIGWQQKPRYDAVTNNLEWATISESEGHKVINYNIRYLGRNGVMEIVLVGGPEELKTAVGITKDLLKKYSFKKGSRYSEFVEGDKVAEYGLAALVTGGGIAMAAKSGLLAKFWKVIVAGFVAAGAFVKKFAGRIFGRKETAVAKNTEEGGADTKPEA